jgi:hypothetical protein
MLLPYLNMVPWVGYCKALFLAVSLLRIDRPFWAKTHQFSLPYHPFSQSKGQGILKYK